jgi:hypothetical protein
LHTSAAQHTAKNQKEAGSSAEANQFRAMETIVCQWRSTRPFLS